jgi:hypothetical protein
LLPLFDPLRDDPGFQVLVKQMNLAGCGKTKLAA